MAFCRARRDGNDFASRFPMRVCAVPGSGWSSALAGIVMIFVSFTSAYVVRQGLPTLDPRTGALVHDWIPVRLPNCCWSILCVADQHPDHGAGPPPGGSPGSTPALATIPGAS